MECQQCFGTEFQMVDGLSYCSRCGTQSATALFETEIEDMGAFASSQRAFFDMKTRRSVRKSTVTEAEAKRKMAEIFGVEDTTTHIEPEPERKTHTKIDKDEICLGKEFKLFDEKRSDLVWMHHVGRRLTTFTKMLAMITISLKEGHQVSDSVVDIAFALWKRYLSTQGVLFFDGETTENEEEMYKRVVANVVSNEQLLARRAEKKKKAKEKLGQDKDVWDMITSQHMNEDLEMSEDDEDDETLEAEQTTDSDDRLFSIHKTNMKADTFVRAGIVHLSPLLLLAIVHHSLLLSGCSRILLSDLIRWLREGRFVYTTLQQVAFAPVYIDDDFGYFKWFGICRYKLDFHLHDVYSLSVLVSTITKTPHTPFEYPLLDIVSRHLHTLNLPDSFIQQAAALIATLELNEELSLEKLEELTQFDKIFQQDGGRIKVNPLPRIYKKLSLFVPSKECISAGVILLLLKLCYGLVDDSLFERGTEWMMSFDLGAWLWQLNMRLGLSKGDEIEDIQYKYDHPVPDNFDVDFGIPVFPGSFFYWKAPNTGPKEPVRLAYKYRQFGGFAPSWDAIPPRVTEDHVRTRVNVFEDDIEIHMAVTPSAFYSPLEAVAEAVNSSFTDSIRLLKHNFKPSLVPENESEDDDVDDDGEEKWHRHFPSAAQYERLPRPPFAVSSSVAVLTQEEGFRILGPSLADSSFALQYAVPSMSRPFAFLLHSISRVIGEDPSVLYGVFLLLEYRLLDADRLSEMEEALEGDGGVEVSIQNRRVRTNGIIRKGENGGFHIEGLDATAFTTKGSGSTGDGESTEEEGGQEDGFTDEWEDEAEEIEENEIEEEGEKEEEDVQKIEPIEDGGENKRKKSKTTILSSVTAHPRARLDVFNAMEFDVIWSLAAMRFL